MANDIGNFFRAETNREAALDGISSHINKFWTRRMRQRLLEYVQHGGNELDELPLAATAQVTVAPARAQPAAAAAPTADTAPTPALSPEPTPAQHQSPVSPRR
jgi:formate dehydrogenase subunit delta